MTWWTDWNASNFFTNDWLNDKEIWYDENDICRIQSTAKQHWCIYQCWLYAPHWLPGSGEEFNNYSLIWLCIKRTCHWWTTWICKIVSWWNDANVGRCRGFFNNIAVESPLIINELWALIIFCIKIPMYNEISFKKAHIA